jgi:hypothetical protein
MVSTNTCDLSGDEKEGGEEEGGKKVVPAVET